MIIFLTIIIPTCNRTDPLKTLLKSISMQRLLATNYEIIIVDSSKNSILNAIKEINGRLNLPIKYIESKVQSLTVQKNIAVRNISPKTTLICFLDDDIVFYHNSIKNMLDFINSHNEVSAFVFNIMNLGVPKFNFLKKLFFYGSGNHGEILKSSFHTFIGLLPESKKVSFVCGGASVIRIDCLMDIVFDEWFVGYGLYEDLEFSIRFIKNHSVWAVAEAKILHDSIPVGAKGAATGKKNYFEFGKGQFLNRHYIICKHKEFSKIAFYFASFFQIFRNIAMSVYKRDTSYLKIALGNVFGLFSVLLRKNIPIL